MAESTPENAQVPQEIAQEMPEVEKQFEQDQAAWNEAMNALKDVGYAAEESAGLLAHLWQRGVAVVLHKSDPSQPPAVPQGPDDTWV